MRALVAKVEGAELPVDLDVRGSPRRLPPGVELNAYRIVQESLTNALKHGDGGPVTAAVTCAAGAVDVRVDSGLGAPGPAGTGSGLIGMRERAALLGGTLSAGPVGGRWVVRAHLPWGGG
jgi:signal transduction histidine kinase